MIELRKHFRYKTHAKVKLKEYGEEEFTLKNLSVTGCRMECTIDTKIMPQRHYKLEIIPESDAKIEAFSLETESKWIHLKSNSCEAGFLITEPPKGKQFQRYVDYLAWRYSQGNSMTDDPDIPGIT
jgi:hypothetical protein